MHALRKHASPSPQGKSKPVGQWRTKACLTLTCGRSYRQREPCVRNEQRAMRTFRARQVSFTCFEVSGSPHDRRKRRLGKRNPVGQIQILHKHCIGRCPTWMSYRQLVIAIRTSALGIKTWGKRVDPFVHFPSRHTAIYIRQTPSWLLARSFHLLGFVNLCC